MKRYNIFRIKIAICIVAMLFSLSACRLTKDDAKNIDYKEYISSFIQNNELRMFEFSSDLDLESSVHIAMIMKSSNIEISAKNKNNIKNAFTKQLIRPKYQLGYLYVNNNLDVWADYLTLVEDIDKKTFVDLKEKSHQMLIELISNWDKSIKDLNLDNTDDMLTRLNILLQLKKINSFVNDKNISKDIELLSSNEYNIFENKVEEKNSTQIIPYIYYFSNLNVGDLNKYKKQTLNQINSMLQNIKEDNYTGYFFYLPFIYSVMENFNQSFKQEYRQYNIHAINTAMSTNTYDWNAAWTSLCLTRDLLSDYDKNNILNKMNINKEIDISQPQIIYLSDTYSNIYYFLYLAHLADIDFSDDEKSCINVALKTISEKHNEDYSLKDCYYSLKLRAYDFLNKDYLLNDKYIDNIIKKNIDENGLNVHDAGSIYYLMILNKEYNFSTMESIRGILDKLYVIVNNENIDDTILNTLNDLFDYSNEPKNKLDIEFFTKDDAFQERIYFVSMFSNNLNHSFKSELFDIVKSYSVQYGYSAQKENKKLELEATFRLKKSVNDLSL